MNIFFIELEILVRVQSPNGTKICQFHGRQNPMKQAYAVSAFWFSRKHKITARISEYREQEVKRTRSKKWFVGRWIELASSNPARRTCGRRIKNIPKGTKMGAIFDQRPRNGVWKNSQCICIFWNSSATRPGSTEKKNTFSKWNSKIQIDVIKIKFAIHRESVHSREFKWINCPEVRAECSTLVKQRIKKNIYIRSENISHRIPENPHKFVNWLLQITSSFNYPLFHEETISTMSEEQKNRRISSHNVSVQPCRFVRTPSSNSIAIPVVIICDTRIFSPRPPTLHPVTRNWLAATQVRQQGEPKISPVDPRYDSITVRFDNELHRGISAANIRLWNFLH